MNAVTDLSIPEFIKVLDEIRPPTGQVRPLTDEETSRALAVELRLRALADAEREVRQRIAGLQARAADLQRRCQAANETADGIVFRARAEARGIVAAAKLEAGERLASVEKKLNAVRQAAAELSK